MLALDEETMNAEERIYEQLIDMEQVCLYFVSCECCLYDINISYIIVFGFTKKWQGKFFY